MGKVQSGAVEGGRCEPAVATGQDFVQPPGRLCAGADLDEAAHEVAHHMVQKTIGMEVA